MTLKSIIPPEQWERERQADGTFRVRCCRCAKSVSSPLVEPVIVRAWVECPECLEESEGDDLTVPLAVVHEQAKDDGLWFHAITAPEAYLQLALRRLHAAVERVSRGKATP